MSTQSLDRVLTSGVDQAWARLTDPGVSRSRADLATDATVTLHEVDGDDVRVGIDTPVPEKWVPPMVRGRTGGGYSLPTVRRVEQWRRDGDTVTGTMTIDIDGVPADASGRMSLTPSGGGTAAHYEVSLKVHIPLVGRVVEATVLPQILTVIGQELAILDRA